MQINLTTIWVFIWWLIHKGFASETSNFKLLFFREDCFNEFLNFNFFYSDCISITLSKGLGYGIILGSCMVRLPQIIKLYLNGSCEGLVPKMFYMDNYMMIIVGWYNVHLNNPFSVYGKNFLIFIQNITIVFLIWKYNKDITMKSKILVVITTMLLFIILFTDKIIPDEVWTFMLNIQFIMLTVARMPQILYNIRMKSTGQLSLITYSWNTFGLLARFFTLLKETKDFLNFLSTFLALFFNAILTLQILWYWREFNKTKCKHPNDLEKLNILNSSSDIDIEIRSRVKKD